MLRSLPVGVVIAAGVVATSWTHTLLSDHQDLVVHTFQVIDTTKDVLIGLDDAETGQRGYLLSGDRRYLDPYDKALSRLIHLRSDLKTGISDNADQEERVRRLDTLIDTKLGELKHSIDVHDNQGPDAARALEVAMMEKATMDDIRRVIGDLTESEKSLLSKRQSEVDKDETRIRIVAVLVGLASFVTRMLVELYLARKNKRGSGNAAALR
ncbi:CHASE3 domain-containing protein [Oryzifoliimicrobium ureilyticus]|uniref:CHASE3 domain-containing protein n=1 Tax=Oryzifoliimicrobium ureilyticus TaxID=3113724 RepID=UPI0030760DE4